MNIQTFVETRLKTIVPPYNSFPSDAIYTEIAARAIDLINRRLGPLQSYIQTFTSASTQTLTPPTASPLRLVTHSIPRQYVVSADVTTFKFTSEFLGGDYTVILQYPVFPTGDITLTNRENQLAVQAGQIETLRIMAAERVQDAFAYNTGGFSMDRRSLASQMLATANSLEEALERALNVSRITENNYAE